LSQEAALGVQLIATPVLASSDAYQPATLETDAARGPVRALALPTAPIGAFTRAALSFGTPVAGRVSNITLELTPAMELRPGDKITLVLPGFAGPDSPALRVAALLQVPAEDDEHRAIFVEEVAGSMPADGEVAPNVTLAAFAAARNVSVAAGGPLVQVCPPKPPASRALCPPPRSGYMRRWLPPATRAHSRPSALCAPLRHEPRRGFERGQYKNGAEEDHRPASKK
jgi:hypothetical protein